MERCDPRILRTRAAVLGAARELLAEVGIERTNIEDVADRSGVARSTIYRHWPCRTELIREALEDIRDESETAITDDPMSDLRAMVHGLGDKLRSEWSAAMGEVQVAAERDPELAELHAEFVRNKRENAATMVARVRDAGMISRTADPATVGELLASRLFYRRFVAHLPMTTEEVDEHLDLVLGMLAP